jgi:hypothetical protein
VTAERPGCSEVKAVVGRGKKPQWCRGNGLSKSKFTLSVDDDVCLEAPTALQGFGRQHKKYGAIVCFADGWQHRRD